MKPSFRFENPARLLRSGLALAALAVLSPGCAVIQANTWKNEAVLGAPAPTRASEQLTREDLNEKNLYVGIAMSGGGSRAANFSAAVMLELEQMGLLDRATVISSVSGSSLPAAYYGLFGQHRDTNLWNAASVREHMRTDFESAWLWRWLRPDNIAQYWLTNFSRSDIMEEVFDSNLYAKKTFAAMGQGQPRIILNSTEVSRGGRFTFTDQTFEGQLHSQIGNYPVAKAVMASSAFPGVFQDVTLRGYAAAAGNLGADAPAPAAVGFLHVIDGGPSDNLGTTTLIEALAGVSPREERKPPAGSPAPVACLLIVVDAYPNAVGSEFTARPETRGLIDYFFDTNVANSSDALLSARRIDLLGDLGLAVRANDPEVAPFNETSRVRFGGKVAFTCAVWYIGLPRLLSKEFQAAPGARELGEIVNSIPTRFALVSGKAAQPLEPEVLQGKLFEAAHRLIEEDRYESSHGTQVRVKDGVCSWMREKGVELQGCTGMVAQAAAKESGHP